MKTNFQNQPPGYIDSPTIEAGNRENVNWYNVKAYHFFGRERYPIFDLRFKKSCPWRGQPTSAVAAECRREPIRPIERLLPREGEVSAGFCRQMGALSPCNSRKRLANKAGKRHN
jgi:hypothetical protein